LLLAEVCDLPSGLIRCRGRDGCEITDCSQKERGRKGESRKKGRRETERKEGTKERRREREREKRGEQKMMREKRIALKSERERERYQVYGGKSRREESLKEIQLLDCEGCVLRCIRKQAVQIRVKQRRHLHSSPLRHFRRCERERERGGGGGRGRGGGDGKKKKERRERKKRIRIVL
jgi:hypothetical protein